LNYEAGMSFKGNYIRRVTSWRWSKLFCHRLGQQAARLPIPLFYPLTPFPMRRSQRWFLILLPQFRLHWVAPAETSQ